MVMNENIDLIKILKDCPEGTKFYSSLFGEVEFQQVELGFTYSIVIKLKDGLIQRFTSNGKLFNHYDGECTLFPSKDQRDWSKFSALWYKKKFDPKTLKPFDKVLVYDIYDICEGWACALFSHIRESEYPYSTSSGSFKVCIPYNDDTKHLLGTTDEVPEYYRYWED